MIITGRTVMNKKGWTDVELMEYTYTTAADLLRITLIQLV